MNFDPYDSVAWRSFGMLDDDEKALFEDAMRQDPGLRRACLEMDRLVAAIAATTADPVMPQPEQLEHLQRRLGLLRGGRKCPLWLTASGWASAAVLAAFLGWNLASAPKETPVTAAPRVQSAAPVAPANGASATETKRLSDEIDLLRKNLEEFHQRDRSMFQVLPGRALPLVMTMVPPGQVASSRPALTAMLGDALAVTNRHAVLPEPSAETDVATDDTDPPEAEVPLVTGPPMAVPIYDAARDAGTLVVSNLPPAGEGNVYNLWVVTDVGAKPVYLGSLPESSALGADSFDFNLGSTMVLPAGFLLTLDPLNAPATPAKENTVLQGPPAASR
jgi:anti-sigma-K factor RskA